MAEQFRRRTAYKVWIGDIHRAKSKVQESGLLVYDIREKDVARVNILGGVINVFSAENYGSMMVDDGSGNIRLKVWGDDKDLFEGKNIGDVVLVVGRVGDFNGERYVRPEIVRKVEMDWALLRRLELVKEYGTFKKEEKVVVKIEEEVQEEVEPSLAAREIVMNLIEKFEEVDEEKLVVSSKMPRDKIMVALNDLLKEGEVFCPKKGFYRLV